MARDIIEIDEEKCTGCGLCIKDCAEGALAIVDGKAKLVSDVYCDGLGACLGACPEGALRIIKRDAPEFDEEAAMKAKEEREGVENSAGTAGKAKPQPHGCPGSMARKLEPQAHGCPGSMARKLEPLGNMPGVKNVAGLGGASPSSNAGTGGDVFVSGPSALGNWPIQLALVPVNAPYLKNARLLVAADCVGFALSRLHESFMSGRILLIGCPKLDNAEAYVDKLADIIKANGITDITVLHMSVPCCRGMAALTAKAIERAGADIVPTVRVITPEGGLVLDF